MVQLLHIVYIISVLCTCVNAGDRVREAGRLFEILTQRGRDTYVRPKGDNTSDRTNVATEFSLLGVHDLNTHDQTISTTFRLDLRWKDERMQWSISDYGNIKYIRMPPDTIWKPDFGCSYGCRTAKEELVRGNSMLKVWYTGEVNWQPTVQLKTSCTMDMEFFPFDSQYCGIKFYIENYDRNEISLTTPDQVRLDDYRQNEEWYLWTASANLSMEASPAVSVSLGLQRREGFFKLVFMTPATIVALLVPFIFVLPPGSTAKITMGFGIVLTIILLLGMTLPFLPSSFLSPPPLVLYYISLLAEVSVSLAVSAIFSTLATRAATPRNPPAFLKKIIVDKLGKIVCVSPSTLPQQMPVDDAEIEGATVASKGTMGTPSDQVAPAVHQYYLLVLVIDRLLFVISMLTIIVTIIAYVLALSPY